MWPFIAKFSRFVILATALIGISILISFVTKLNLKLNDKIEPKSTLVNAGELMYNVRITKNGDYKCTGTLIHSKNVITLGSCVKDVMREEVFKTATKIRIGSNAPTGRQYKNYDVEEITLHPNYGWENYKDDIAVIRLTETIPFCAPISYLPKKKADKGLKLNVSGLGSVEYFRDRLYSFNMTIIDSEKCRKHVLKTEKLSTDKVLDMSTKFCAVAEHGSDHPLSSWGSPATVDGEYIVGIYLGHVNYYWNAPGIFVNVSDYIAFINEQIK